VTESRRFEATRASLEMQVREAHKMQAIGTLAGGIAHDFNNIIATILGNADLAREDVSNNPLALQSLQEIQKAGSRARDLVWQILSFSRRQPTERKLVALAPILEESVRLLRATMPARLEIDLQCESATAAVLADASQIQQVLLNLATNAMQAMSGRSGRIEIRLDQVTLDAALLKKWPALRALNEQSGPSVVRMRVRDDGPGMDAAVQERIFEPFFTTKPKGEGTGLGLSVVLGIVQTHQGAITVESRIGQGSTFSLYLPLPAAAGMSDPRSPVEARTPDPASPASTTSLRILYLDDDEALVFLVRRLLQRRGCQVSGFVSADYALAALRDDPHAFDLVVSDYNMPGMSGLDFARAVRLIRPELPVAVATGFVDEQLRSEATNAGIRELIFKADAVDVFCDAMLRLAWPRSAASR
jgi:nitrogen-specific signal transduction histidine kinase/ActR/RegA family two-component response regulator